jgi:hypothetical protein
MITAVVIARNIDLITLDDEPDEGDCNSLRPQDEGKYLPDVNIDEITSRCVVFARAQPADCEIFDMSRLYYRC